MNAVFRQSELSALTDDEGDAEPGGGKRIPLMKDATAEGENALMKKELSGLLDEKGVRWMSLVGGILGHHCWNNFGGGKGLHGAVSTGGSTLAPPILSKVNYRRDKGISSAPLFIKRK